MQIRNRIINLNRDLAIQGFSAHEVFSRTVVRQIAEDQKGNIWFGILEGVSRFDGETFHPFPIPESEPDELRGVTSAKIVHSIMEDSRGNMWFGTNGGAYIYDGTSLSNLSETDGLCHNSVNDILEDSRGQIWFATHHNGVCRWDPEQSSFTHVSQEERIEGTESWSLYEDRSGNIWFPIENAGVYRYDTSDSLTTSAKPLSNFHKKDIQSRGLGLIFRIYLLHSK